MIAVGGGLGKLLLAVSESSASVPVSCEVEAASGMLYLVKASATLSEAQLHVQCMAILAV